MHRQKQHILTAGFSLVEMTIVLLILSILATSGITIYSDSQKRETFAATRDRMEDIQQALESYRYTHNRLPCPADATMISSNPNYGLQASIGGNCTIDTVQANDESNGVVVGMLPVRSLNLPDEYAYDGWERRFTYLVSTPVTENNAFLSDNGSSWDGDIIVKDANNSERTNRAVYALISHGENGHGAYLQSGQRRNAKSTNTQELDNAGVDASFAANFDNAIVMRRQTENASDYNDDFDDIIRYKERWAIMGNSDSFKAQNIVSRLGVTNSFLASYCNTAAGGPWLQGFDYSRANGLTAGSTKFHIEGDWPVGCISGFSLSPDRTLFAAVLDSSPWLSYAIWTNRGYTNLPIPLFVDLPQNGGGYPRLAWSPDGVYLAIANNTSSSIGNRILIYKRNTTTNALTRLIIPFTSFGGISEVYDVTWHPSSRFVAFAGANGNKIAVLRKDDATTFTNVIAENANAICTIPGGGAPPCTAGSVREGQTYGVEFSSDGSKLLALGTLRPATTIYDFNPTGPEYLREAKRHSGFDNNGKAAAFSHDMEFMVEAIDFSIKINRWDPVQNRYVFKNVADASCVDGYVKRFRFAPDDSFLAMATTTGHIVTGTINYRDNTLECENYDVPGTLQAVEIMFTDKVKPR